MLCFQTLVNDVLCALSHPDLEGSKTKSVQRKCREKEMGAMRWGNKENKWKKKTDREIQGRSRYRGTEQEGKRKGMGIQPF